MFSYIINVFKIFFLFVVIDGIWLVTMSQRLYRHYLGYLFADSFAYSWAILFYILYAAAVTHFIVMPYMASEVSIFRVFLEGFFFGLVVYSAYDLTNQATIKNWPFIVTIVDMLWGGILTGLVSAIAHKLILKLP